MYLVEAPDDIQALCHVYKYLTNCDLCLLSLIVQVFDLTSCAACPGGCGMNVLLLFLAIL